MIANLAITLIHQCDLVIQGIIEWKKRDFLERGGIKEEMYKARKDWQKRNGAYGRFLIMDKIGVMGSFPTGP